MFKIGLALWAAAGLSATSVSAQDAGQTSYFVNKIVVIESTLPSLVRQGDVKALREMRIFMDGISEGLSVAGHSYRKERVCGSTVFHLAELSRWMERGLNPDLPTDHGTPKPAREQVLARIDESAGQYRASMDACLKLMDFSPPIVERLPAKPSELF